MDDFKVLGVRVPRKVYNEVRIRAIKQNKTMQEYVNELLEKSVGERHG